MLHYQNKVCFLLLAKLAFHFVAGKASLLFECRSSTMAPCNFRLSTMARTLTIVPVTSLPRVNLHSFFNNGESNEDRR